MRLFKKPRRSQQAQSRILEAVVAAVIIFIVFSAATFLISSSDIKVLQESADLDRLGYNVLDSVVESGTIEERLESDIDPTFVGTHIKTIIQKALPSTIYFSLTVFNCTDTGTWVELQQVDLPTANNTSTETLSQCKEISSTTLMYTSKRGNIYNLVLVLARSGDGE